MHFDIQKTGKRIVGLILRPSGEWQKIKADNAYQSGLRQVALPLMIINAIVLFFQVSIVQDTLFTSFFKTILLATGAFLSSYFSLLVSAIVFRELLKNYKVYTSIHEVFSFICYSSVPFLIAAVFVNLFRFADLIRLFGFYSFYILALGIQAFYPIPKEKRGTFLILSMMLMIVAFTIVSVFVKAIIQGIALSLLN